MKLLLFHMFVIALVNTFLFPEINYKKITESLNHIIIIPIL